MPALPCSLGLDCKVGEDGGTWKTVDIPFDQAMVLLENHHKNAHNKNVADQSNSRPTGHHDVTEASNQLQLLR